MKKKKNSISATTLQPLDTFIPRIQKRISSVIVKCPQCGADIGEPCFSRTNGRALHRSRRVQTIRLNSQNDTR